MFSALYSNRKKREASVRVRGRDCLVFSPLFFFCQQKQSFFSSSPAALFFRHTRNNMSTLLFQQAATAGGMSSSMYANPSTHQADGDDMGIRQPQS
jgi:hypothetical protein